jgi:hypothetical protein
MVSIYSAFRVRSVINASAIARTAALCCRINDRRQRASLPDVAVSDPRRIVGQLGAAAPDAISVVPLTLDSPTQARAQVRAPVLMPRLCTAFPQDNRNVSSSRIVNLRFSAGAVTLCVSVSQHWWFRQSPVQI